VAQPYVGEIRTVGFNFAPSGWMFCNGQLLSISNYEVLFNLIGTTYGGDGQNTFALPNLQSRVAIHAGTGSQTYVIGQAGGVESVQLTTNQIPIHTHPIVAQGDVGNAASPVNAYFAASSADQYASSATGTTGSVLANNGSSQSHNNIQPYVAINYVISLFGVYPSQN
jgi:microcystin-dependent protein